MHRPEKRSRPVVNAENAERQWRRNVRLQHCPRFMIVW